MKLIKQFKHPLVKKLLAFIISKSKLVQAWMLHYNFKHACKVANEMRARTNKKHQVYKMNGRFVVIERQRVKELQREGYFKRGLNLKQVEAAALYTTY